MPQMTAINPFRQNGIGGVPPQATGFNLSPFGPSPTTPSSFGLSPSTSSSFGPSPSTPSPFGPSPTTQGTSPFPVFGQTPGQPQQAPLNSTSPFNINQQPNVNSPFTLPQQLQQQQSQPPPQPQSPVYNMPIPPRPASAPLKTSSPEPINPLVAQQTGSKNPFGIPTSPPPPVPKVPTLMELALNKQQELKRMQQQQQQQNGQLGQASSPTLIPSSGSAMSSVASDFASLNFGNSKPATSSLSPQMTSTTNSSFSTDTLFSSVSTQQTGATASTIPSISAQPTSGLTSHTTGLGTFTGLKTFKPSSSFGASLLESLPPIPGSGPATPSVTTENQGQLGSPPNSAVSSPGPTTTRSATLGGPGLNTQPNALGALNSQQPLTTGLGGGLGTGLNSGLGSGLGYNLSATNGTGIVGVGVGSTPQTTDAQGVANPFKTTVFSNSAPTQGFGGIGDGLSGGFGTNPGLGPGGGFNGGFGGLSGTPFGQNPNAQPQQQQQQGSLI